MLVKGKQKIKEDLDSVDGELRIALSSGLGKNLVTPRLNDFFGPYPILGSEMFTDNL